MPDAPHPLLAGSAKKRLFAMLRRTRDPALLRQHLDEHLRWMIGEEGRGRIFLSGTAEPADDVALDGLTVLQAGSLEEARAVADRDPLIVSGAVAYSLHPWIANEGSLTLTVRLSDSSGALR